MILILPWMSSRHRIRTRAGRLAIETPSASRSAREGSMSSTCAQTGEPKFAQL
jgi:hypothetical protein